MTGRGSAGGGPRPSEADAPLGRIHPGRIALVLGLALILAGGAYALIGRIGDTGGIEAALSEADWRLMPVCLAGVGVSYVGYVLAYRGVAAAFGGPVIPWGWTIRIVMAGFGAFTIGTTAGGMAVQWWAMHRAGLGTGESARRTLGLSTLQWLVLSSATALAAAAALLGAATGVPAWLAATWVAAVPVAVLLAAWVSAPGRRDTLSRTDGVNPLRAAFGAAIGGVVVVRRLLVAPRGHLVALAGYPVYWLGDVVCFGAALAAFGPMPSPAGLLVAYATGYIAVALPLPAGGAGGVDAAMVLMLTVVGVDLDQALLGVLVYRLFTFWLPLLPALVVVPTLPRLARELSGLRRGDTLPMQGA